jgi:hypothetical protein
MGEDSAWFGATAATDMLAFRLGLESTRSSRSLRNGHFIFPPMAFDAENAAQ